MDGVLVNSEPVHYRIWLTVLEQYGLTVDYALYESWVGTTLASVFKSYKEHYGIDLDTYPDIPGQLKNVFKDFLEKGEFPIVEGVKEVLSYLEEKGYGMAVASSSPPLFIEKNMNQLGIKDYFTVLCSAEKVARSKPAPDVFLEAARLLGAKPEECAVVEDSFNGVTAAKAAGMKCFGFQNPDSGKQDLSAADVVFYPFIELKKLL